MLRGLFMLFGVIGIAFSVKGQRLPVPYNLRSDLLLRSDEVTKNGLGAELSLTDALGRQENYQFPQIVSERPIFSWELDTAVTGISAYRVLVASSLNLLNSNKPDFWDSGKVFSQRGNAQYNGKSLISGKVYYWKVAIWDHKEHKTLFSEPVSFVSAAQSVAEPFSHYPLAAQVEKAKLIYKADDGAYFLDFRQDALAQLTLHLTSEKPDTIWIEAGELTDRAFSINKSPGRNIRYTKIPLSLKRGTHEYNIVWPGNDKRNSRNPILMPAYIGEVYPFRYVGVHGYRGVLDENSIQRKVVFYPFDENASEFVSSDTTLNQIWDLCKYSIKATSFTGYYVDGDRERIPYEADALINQLSHYAVDGEYSMARRTMNYLLFHPTWPTEWSLQNVLIAWNDYMYTGDERLLKTYYPELQKKILMSLAGSNGLISTRTGKQSDAFLASVHMEKNFDGRRGLHDNVDWPQTGDFIGTEKEHKGETDGFVYNTYNAVINAYYYRNLVLMEKIALVLDRENDAKFYREKSGQVYGSFQRAFRDTDSGLIRDGDSTLHTSLHASMFAMAFGLVRPDDTDKVVNFIKSRKMACSVYGAQFLLDALYDSEQGQYALELMTADTQRSWYNMIRSGSTISMEAWDKVYKPNLDLNHAWGAAPANLIVRQLMGIQPLTPGFEHVQIRPQLGSLTFAYVKAPTIKGPVSVRFDRQMNQDKMEVVVPGGTLATVYVPDAAGLSRLHVNGKAVLAKRSDGFFVLENVPSGSHLFIVN